MKEPLICKALIKYHPMKVLREWVYGCRNCWCCHWMEFYVTLQHYAVGLWFYVVLFYGSVSHTVQSNDRMIGGWWVLESVEGNGLGLIKQYCCVCLGGLGKTSEVNRVSRTHTEVTPFGCKSEVSGWLRLGHSKAVSVHNNARLRRVRAAIVAVGPR
jgi:hypothetical protein